jgi:acyl-CoA thioester hydrolase
MERARTEWLRAIGIDQAALRARERIQFTVVDMKIAWKRAAVFDDALEVTAELTEMRGVSFLFKQQVLRGEQVLAEATVRAAAIDAESLKPRRLTPALLQQLGQ